MMQIGPGGPGRGHLTGWGYHTINAACIAEGLPWSFLHSRWTVREQGITWVPLRYWSCWPLQHGLVYPDLSTHTLIFLLFYILQQLLQASFNKMTFTSKTTYTQCKCWASGISERQWSTWAEEASYLPYCSGLTTSCLCDLGQQFSTAIVSPFVKCK